MTATDVGKASPKVAFVAKCLLVFVTVIVWTAALIAHKDALGPSDTAATSESSGSSGFGLGNSGSGWDPNQDPIVNGQVASLTHATSSASYPIYLPNVPAAQNSSVARVWQGSTGTSDGLLPAAPRSIVAVAYTSGIQIVIVPNQYTPGADPFSQAAAAASYQQLSVETNGEVTVDKVLGIPVRVIAANYLGQGNPGSVYFALGTTNDDAVVISVLGRTSTSSLEAVAASMISQWQSGT
jgi:hypothetical protein